MKRIDASPTPTSTPARRLVAAGVKRGTGPLVIEQPQYPPLPTERAARRRALTVRGW